MDVRRPEDWGAGDGVPCELIRPHPSPLPEGEGTFAGRGFALIWHRVATNGRGFLVEVNQIRGITKWGKCLGDVGWLGKSVGRVFGQHLFQDGGQFMGNFG